MRPHRRLDMRLVGIGLPVTEIVADDVDAGGALGYFTPALTSQLLSCCVNYADTALQVAHPDQVAEVEAVMVRASPGGFPPGFLATAAQAEAKADRAIKPLSIAFGVFGGTTALAALVIAAQVIGRYLRRRRQESEVLRALGADPADPGGRRPHRRRRCRRRRVGTGRPGGRCSFAPQPSRPGTALLPDPRDLVRLDHPRRWVRRPLRRPRPGGRGARPPPFAPADRSPSPVCRPTASTLLRGDMLLGLPAPAATGLRFALGPGNDVDTVPMRSAIVGAALAATVLISTITFGASLDHLVSTPRLYGWNWSYALSGGDGGGGGDIPAHQATTMLAHDHYLSAWSAVYFSSVIIDGQEVAAMSVTPGALVQPPLLDGHGLQQPDEVVVGALTLASLHKHVGDTITVSGGEGGSHRLRIVGVATMPTIGGTGALHLEMGSGAVVASIAHPGRPAQPVQRPRDRPQRLFRRRATRASTRRRPSARWRK